MPFFRPSSRLDHLSMLRTSAFRILTPRFTARRLPLTASHVRLLSSAEPKQPPPPGAEEAAQSKEIVMTPGEKVAAASRLTLWGGIGLFAAFCAYYIAAELMPT